MEYLLFGESSLLLAIMVYLINLFKTVKQKTKDYNSALNQKKEYEKKLNLYKNKNLNRRKDFRFPLSHEECVIKIMDIKNNKLKVLQNRSISGYLENISSGGLMFICEIELPIRYDIITEVNFKIKDEEFHLKGVLIRKEEKFHNEYLSYGLKFIDLTSKDQRNLRVLIHNLELEKNKIT